MANHEHLHLVRLPQRMERRKKPGFGSAIRRDTPGRRAHSGALEQQLLDSINHQRRRRKPGFVDPSLILRVRMSGALQEADWEHLGLVVLASDPDKTLVLFSSSEDMSDFRNKLRAYAGEIPIGRKTPAFENFIGAIESINDVGPSDRIGLRFREDGFNSIEDFLPDSEFVVDIEVWDLGSRALRENKIEEIVRFVEGQGAEVYDTYIGISISILRIKASGSVICQLLDINEISIIDLPPTPDVITNDIIDFNIGDVPTIVEISDDSPIIGVIDSGLNDHPLLSGLIAGTFAIPESLGLADIKGHGTGVAGVAVYGDIRAQLTAGSLLTPQARVCSVKVLNDSGNFDDMLLVPKIMEQAIKRLKDDFGCKIVNISLGDLKSPYQGGKVGTWAAVLDEISRSLDILIVVSAGNRCPRSGMAVEEGVTSYPEYLLEDNNRILEPAGGINVLSIGSMSQHHGINNAIGQYVSNRPIAYQSEPSPFTRVGPGVAGMIKPDLVDFGGTMVYDPTIGRLRSGDDVSSAGVITLNHRFLERLLRSGAGTSYSAPMIANKAAYILRRLPNASANLLRALLVSSAVVPTALSDRFGHVISDDELRHIYGNGHPSKENASYSDDNRVVLYTEDILDKDYFAVYEVPIPTEYQSGNGVRQLKVTLAFDPPVRHSRVDYAGINMSFRVVRGKNPDFIFDHYRRRGRDDGRAPELPPRYNCSLSPGANLRDKGTIQSGIATFRRSVEAYGDRYYVIVRCHSGWADYVNSQKYALVVELSQKSNIQLYQKVRQRIVQRVQV